jgi:autoinducer 2-degrading protein
MYIVTVFAHIKLPKVEAFISSTRDNARTSTETEPGVVRFDVMQQADDVTRFVLYEVYCTPEDASRHKETIHYLRWRAAVEPMMSEPRTRVVYRNIFPED